MEDLSTDRINELLTKCISGQASDTEYEEAWYWVHASEDNANYYESLNKAWIAGNLPSPVDQKIVKSAWSKVQKSINKRQGRLISFKQKMLFTIPRVAAILVLAFLSGYFANNFIKKEVLKYEAVSEIIFEAPQGFQSRVTLSDGTKIRLNAATRIKYFNNYGKSNRAIYLDGEAYFEVAKNASLPFNVNVGGIVVKAIGTKFNIQGYTDDAEIITTLIEGKVGVRKSDTPEEKIKTFLTPNQQAVFFKDDATRSAFLKNNNAEYFNDEENIIVVDNVNAEIVTSWKEKNLQLQSESFGNLIKLLERRFNIKIVLKDGELSKYKITGTIENLGAEQTFKALQLLLPMKYTFNKNTVIVSFNQESKAKYEKVLKNNK
jgi:ferric-dicitrate binding protein FerR (iron transport regulator)